MTLIEWALRHNVSTAALTELSRLLVEPDPQIIRDDVGTSEAAVQARTRVAVSKLGWRVWRNNIGAGTLQESGTFVRFGLANDSSAINQSIKSGDLIGLRPVRITPDHVGQTIGQFVSIECKAAGWRFAGTARELAQQKWAQLVIGLGGYARFINDERNVK